MRFLHVEPAGRVAMMIPFASHLPRIRVSFMPQRDLLFPWRNVVDNAILALNVMPPYFHEGFEDFVRLVVPIHQERGLHRADYQGITLRDHLGLRRPENRRFQV
jgi:hypothetical protein